jgi:hypothetical protein
MPEVEDNVYISVIEINDVINIKVEETVENLYISINEDYDEITIAIDEVNDVTNVKVQEVGVKGDFILSDDLIIVTAGKQNNTFTNNVFNFVNSTSYTNNTKTLIYTGALLTSAVHLFRYDSKNWNVTYTYNYNLGDYNGVTKTITKS